MRFIHIHTTKQCRHLWRQRGLVWSNVSNWWWHYLVWVWSCVQNHNKQPIWMLLIVKFPNSSKVGRTTTTAEDRRAHHYQEPSPQVSPGVEASSMTTPTSSNHRVYFDSREIWWIDSFMSMISVIIMNAVESFIDLICFIWINNPSSHTLGANPTHCFTTE